MNALVALNYFGPISYYKLIHSADQVTLDLGENYVKQSYRTRCIIAGPNGSQNLIIPILHKGRRQAIKEVLISYDNNWQALHWKSLESAYRSAPYFEYYEPELQPIYHSFQPKHLIEWNQRLHKWVMSSLRMETEETTSKSYIEDTNKYLNGRDSISPKKESPIETYPSYIQVFQSKYPFIPGLSIVDLLFNMGPEAVNYLNSLAYKGIE